MLSGWEGSIADSRILHDAVTRLNEWTTMRDNLVMQMFVDYFIVVVLCYIFLLLFNCIATDRNSDVSHGSRGRKWVGSTTRRVWTFAEECELMHVLKELALKGNKCDNGFRSRYLLILENMLAAKFSGTGLKGEPHINSKIHIWKRQYVCLKNLLSGIGLKTTTYHVDALPEVWEAQIKRINFADE
ncbi:hypothetical protein ACS0TY_018466 [Phlomoides rotata]